jgi:hypothetical protein
LVSHNGVGNDNRNRLTTKLRQQQNGQSRRSSVPSIAMEDRPYIINPLRSQLRRETSCFRNSRFRKRMRLHRTTTRRRSATAVARNAFVFVASFLLTKSTTCIVSSFTVTDRASTRSRRSSLLFAVAPPRPIDERLFLDNIYSSEHEEEVPSVIEQTTICMSQDAPSEVNSKGDDNDEAKEASKDATSAATNEASRVGGLAEQRRRAMAAEMLRSRKFRSIVGPRKTGSASKRTTSERVLDAMRRSALRPTTAGILDKKSASEDGAKAASKVTRSVIQSAIEEIMENHTARANHGPDDFSSSSSSTIRSSLSSFVGKSIGVLGEQQDWKVLRARMDMSKLTIVETDTVLIRMASSRDDVDIANLRLSVFADFSADERSYFCAYVLRWE